MTKRTRRMNCSCARAEFWNRIKLHLDSLAGIIEPIEHLMPEDKTALREIQYLIYQSTKLAQSQETYQKQKLLHLCARNQGKSSAVNQEGDICK